MKIPRVISLHAPRGAGTLLVLQEDCDSEVMGGPGVGGGWWCYIVIFHLSWMGGVRVAAKCLEGPLPVQYFILIGPGGVRGVSAAVESNGKTWREHFLRFEKHWIRVRRLQREQRKWGEGSADKKRSGLKKSRGEEIEKKEEWKQEVVPGVRTIIFQCNKTVIYVLGETILPH